MSSSSSSIKSSGRLQQCVGHSIVACAGDWRTPPHKIVPRSLAIVVGVRPHPLVRPSLRRRLIKVVHDQAEKRGSQCIKRTNCSCAKPIAAQNGATPPLCSYRLVSLALATCPGPGRSSRSAGQVATVTATSPCAALRATPPIRRLLEVASSSNLLSGAEVPCRAPGASESAKFGTVGPRQGGRPNVPYQTCHAERATPRVGVG